MDSWDAVETVERIRKRDVTATEVLEAAIARAQAAVGLNAIVTDTFERARANISRASPDGPFAGLPTLVKDLAQLKGVATGWGSAGAAGLVSKKSDPFVAKLEKSGVLVIGKSSTPEFGMTATTEPLCRGATRNPWDTTRTPGGSSGGAGALVAAGVIPLAHGSDGGGSIRIPAACLGLVGFKRTRGKLDMEGSNLLPVNVAVHGCLTRTVRDTIAFHRAMSGLGEVAPEPKKPLRVGLSVDAPIGTAVDPEMKDAVRAAGRACEALGHRVSEIPCPIEAQVIDDFLAYWGFVAWIQIKSVRLMLHRGFDKTRFEPWTNGLASSFTSAPRSSFAAIARLRRFHKAYSEQLKHYDVLLSPTVASPPPPLGHLAPDLPYQTHYDRVRAFAPFTAFHNAAGAPAISLPLGRTKTGLPLGVQLAAARDQDALLLSLALTLEQANPWPLRAPRGP
jgi:amidase